MSEGLANVGSIEMAQGTWSQLFIITKSLILQAEDGMATRKSQEVLSSLLSGWCPASSLTFFLVAFKQIGKEEGMPIPTCQDSVSEPRKASLINCGTLSTNPQVFFDLSGLPPTNH